jgi:AraC-like DNA-binding protein
VAKHLRYLAGLRRVRDRIDPEYAQPLDVEALARGAHMSVTKPISATKRT